MNKSPFYRLLAWTFCLVLAGTGTQPARSEAMLELFQMSWNDLSTKMPELAEAGYTSLWLPQPTKAGGASSVGYDIFDPFDLGDKNQNGTIATKYGTKADLLRMVETAHRFGIRVYFDNVMNHRQGVVPGYNAFTPTNFFPGLLPQDFHLQTTSSGNRNWPNVQNWGDQGDVQLEPINGLCDLATEPGLTNFNFGPNLFNTTSKLFFVRQPNNPDYYMDTNSSLLGSWTAGSSQTYSWVYTWSNGFWHGFNGTNGQPVPELVEDYLTRAAMWTLYTTKCDGFRLDAVKHVPSQFFGDYLSSWRGYVGGIQAMFDYVHGYGSNVTGNGYIEQDDMRNSCFDTEAPRNDAMLFGEHLGPPPSYSEYINAGMRLLNAPLRTMFNGALSGGGSLPSGLDERDFNPGGGFSAAQGVQFAEDQDALLCCPTHREMQDTYYFMHEGLPMVYSDGFNWAGNPSSSSTFPEVPMTDFLGQYGDNTMPETCYLHHQMARGGTRSRWSDSHIVAFERYDYRDPVSGDPYTNVDSTVMLFAMNATYNNPQGDVLFDDGVARTPDGYYTCNNGSPSKGYGLCVAFAPGSVLSEMASSSPGGGNSRTCHKLLVHAATTSLQAAINSTNASDPAQRLIYVNTTPPVGGGAIELLIPAGGWVMYGYQWPEASRGNVLTNAITFRQGGAAAPVVTVFRHDGTNGDPNFGPAYPFQMRGSVDPFSGNTVMASGEGNVSNLTYAIGVPVLTNAPFDIALCCDASAANILAKMDGGLDLNSQMGYAPTNSFDLRDNQPGYASDVYLGYEQATQQFRNGPEKFAAHNISRDNVTSLGAETYYYTVGGTNLVVNGSGNGNGLNAQTATWVYHDPLAPVTVLTNGSVPVAPATQMVPTNPAPSQSVDIWVKVGYQFQIDTCYLYYTTDGSNPEGAFGVGKGTTQVQQGFWVNHDSADSTIDWWKATIPSSAQTNAAQVRYKIAVYHQNVPTISDADNSKLYGLTQFGITNFNPATVRVWLHNDLNTNNTAIGLSSGFHILRSRCFLPRGGKSSVYNTFIQTFYYDGPPPSGVVAFPTNGNTITSSTYQVVVRADATVSGVDFNIQDSDPSNDDANTGQSNGNGNTNGQPVFVSATQVSPDPKLNQQYPGYPNEFRFNYVSVPSSGTANIAVRLKTIATGIYPTHFTTLSNQVNTAAPANVMYFSSPSADGTPVLLYSNGTYLVQACFTPSLDSSNSAAPFSFYINGVLQPRSSYIFRPSGSVAGCPGLSSFFFNWTPQEGSNFLQLTITNGVTLSATRFVPVGIYFSTLDSDGDGMPDWMELIAGTNPYDPNSPKFRIVSLTPGDPVGVAWNSISNKTYEVFSTTNLSIPMAPDPNGMSVPANLATNMTQWLDPAPDATNKFYRIEVLH